CGQFDRSLRADHTTAHQLERGVRAEHVTGLGEDMGSRFGVGLHKFVESRWIEHDRPRTASGASDVMRAVIPSLPELCSARTTDSQGGQVTTHYGKPVPTPPMTAGSFPPTASVCASASEGCRSSLSPMQVPSSLASCEDMR